MIFSRRRERGSAGGVGPGPRSLLTHTGLWPEKEMSSLPKGFGQRWVSGIRRFVREESAEGTTSGGVRIALWVIAGLAVAGFVGAKVIVPMINKGQTCANAASSQTTTAFTSGTQASC